MSRGKMVNWFCVEIHVKTEVLNTSYHHKSNWGKVMFSQVPVNLFTGGGYPWSHMLSSGWESLAPGPLWGWVCARGGVCAGVGVGTHLPQTCCTTGCGQQLGGVHPTRILFCLYCFGCNCFALLQFSFWKFSKVRQARKSMYSPARCSWNLIEILSILTFLYLRRCSQTTVNPETATFHPKFEPLKTLRR